MNWFQKKLLLWRLSRAYSKVDGTIKYMSRHTPMGYKTLSEKATLSAMAYLADARTQIRIARAQLRHE